MCRHPEQTMALAAIKMREIAEGTARMRLEKAVMNAQQAESKGQPSKLSVLHALVS